MDISRVLDYIIEEEATLFKDRGVTESYRPKKTPLPAVTAKVLGFLGILNVTADKNSGEVQELRKYYMDFLDNTDKYSEEERQLMRLRGRVILGYDFEHDSEAIEIAYFDRLTQTGLRSSYKAKKDSDIWKLCYTYIIIVKKRIEKMIADYNRSRGGNKARVIEDFLNRREWVEEELRFIRELSAGSTWLNDGKQKQEIVPPPLLAVENYKDAIYKRAKITMAVADMYLYACYAKSPVLSPALCSNYAVIHYTRAINDLRLYERVQENKVKITGIINNCIDCINRALEYGDVSEDSLLKVVDLFDRMKVRYWLTGGWGIDVLHGSPTRVHRNINIDYVSASKQSVVDKLKASGYVLETDEDKQLMELVHPEYGCLRLRSSVITEEWGGAPSSWKQSGRYQEGDIDEAEFNGRKIPCLSVAAQFSLCRYIGRSRLSPKEQERLEHDKDIISAIYRNRKY